MSLSLRWQVLWAPAVALAVAGVLLGAEASARLRVTQRVGEIGQMRETLERALVRLQDRHERTVRRAKEAVLEPRRAARDAILAWAAEHYLKEMERYAADLRQAIRDVRVGGADARLPADLERLETQIARITEQARSIALLLDAVAAAVSAEDADAILAANQELERVDRVMESLLRVAQGIVRRAAVWQTQHALAAPAAVPRPVWLLLALWAPLSLFLAQRPLRRLARLATARGAPQLGSPEEAALWARFHEAESDRDAQARLLAERARDVERAAAALRRIEQELALLKLYNENLVNSLRAAIIVTDTTLRIRSFNRTARVLLGLDESRIDTSIEEQPLFAALAAHRGNGYAALTASMDERRPLRFESLPYAAPGGEILLDLAVVPYMDESGAARGLLWVADDVTEAVHTKNQLLAAERLAAVGRLSAQVAHEIRNPLSAIGLNAELLGDELTQDLEEPRRSEAAKLLRAITAEVERLTEVTEGYLRLTRLPRPNRRPIDVNQLVGDLLTMLRPELRAHHIEVSLELASPPAQALADPGQIRQALLNVLRNSREAMSDGGSIRVTTRERAAIVEIEVRDHGPGIAPEVLPRVFEPFFSTKVAGTGLGLSLTRQILLEHSGDIEVANAADGGTRVYITLPAAGPSSEAPDAEIDARSEGSAAGTDDEI